MIGFIIGLFLGAGIGIAIAALAVMGEDDNESRR